MRRVKIRREKNRSGFAPLLIAIGIVSVLAAMSLTSSMQAGMVNKKSVEKLNRAEAFYTTELSAWHGYYRVEDGLAVSTITFENTPYENLDIPGDSYSSTPGSPLNVVTTRQYAPSQSLIRRYGTGRMIAAAPAGGKFCGKTHFSGKKTYQTCLHKPSGTSNGSAWLYGMGAAAMGSPDSNSPTGFSYPHHFWALTKEGKGVSGFGTNGRVDTRIAASAQRSAMTYTKSAPCSSDPKCNEKNVIYFNNKSGLWRFSGVDGRAMGAGSSGPMAGLTAMVSNGATHFQFRPNYLMSGEKMYLPYSTGIAGSSVSAIDWAYFAPGQTAELGSYSHGDYKDSYLDWMITADNKLKVLASSIQIDPVGGQALSFSFLILQFRLGPNIPAGERLDPSFGTGGVVNFDTSGAGLIARFMSDGKIRMVDTFGASTMPMFQFNADGTKDTAFGQNGLVLLPMMVSAGNHIVTLLPDKTIYSQTTQLLLGAVRSVWLARFRPDGTKDTSFGGTGSIVIHSDDRAMNHGTPLFSSEVLVASDGSIVSAFFDDPAPPGGLIPNQAAQDLGCSDIRGICITHLNANGTFVDTFGNGATYGQPGRHFLCAPAKQEGINYFSFALAD